MGTNTPFAGRTGSNNVYVTWVSARCIANTNEYPVFAISSELTVPPAEVPEPGTVALGGDQSPRNRASRPQDRHSAELTSGIRSHFCKVL